jgi:uncharacterized protein (DUF2267 family)
VIGSRRALIDDVMWRTGLDDPGAAATVVALALEELSALLRPEEARFVATSLPEGVAGPLATPRPREPDALDGPTLLYARLSEAEHVSRGVAMEHARAACAAFADALGREQRVLLARRLPAAWAALFEPPPREPGAGLRGTVPGHGHTLATGRPGSARSLAESAPPPAQADSVMRADNPHGATKLSSATATGPTPLARAHPGTEGTIAEARDERRRR